MPAKAELKARLTLDKSLFDRGLALAQGGAKNLAGGLASVAKVGAEGFALAGAASIGLAAAMVIGTKNAFDLGAKLYDLQKRTGATAGNLVILQQAFKDAGLEAEDVGPSVNKMQRYIEKAGQEGLAKFGIQLKAIKGLDPAKQFIVIGQAINSMSNPAARTAAAMTIFGKSGGKLLQLFGEDKAFGNAARALGTQAGLLSQNAEIFHDITIKLGHAGLKLQGFFVGVAARVAGTLLPILNKLDKIDLAGIGQKFGDGIVKGAQALVGFFKNPALLFDTAIDYFKAGILSVGNVLIAAFTTGLEFFKDGMVQVIDGLGSIIIATLMDAFKKPIAYFQAGIETAIGKQTSGSQLPQLEGQRKQIQARRTQAQDKLYSGHTDTFQQDKSNFDQWDKMFDNINAEIAKTKDAAAGNDAAFQSNFDRLMKDGIKVGLSGEGQTAEEWRQHSKDQMNAGLSAAAQAARNFKVPDALGAGAAFAAANRGLNTAAAQGSVFMPGTQSGDPFGFDRMAAMNRRGARHFGDFASTGLLSSGGLRTGGLMGGAYKTSGYNETSIWSKPKEVEKDTGVRTVDELVKSNSKLQELVDSWEGR